MIIHCYVAFLQTNKKYKTNEELGKEKGKEETEKMVKKRAHHIDFVLFLVKRNERMAHAAVSHLMRPIRVIMNSVTHLTGDRHVQVPQQDSCRYSCLINCWA